jgi:hypothetical protein
MEKTLLASVALALAASSPVLAQAPPDPMAQLCDQVAELEAAQLAFETLPVTASRATMDEAVQRVSTAMAQVEGLAMALRPAAFAQLKEAHESLEASIAEVPPETQPEQLLDRTAIARDSERAAYQSLVSNLVCP